MVMENDVAPRSKTPNPSGSVLVLTKFLIGLEIWLVRLEDFAYGRHSECFFYYCLRMGVVEGITVLDTVVCCFITQCCVVNPTGKLIAQLKRIERLPN